MKTILISNDTDRLDRINSQSHLYCSPFSKMRMYRCCIIYRSKLEKDYGEDAFQKKKKRRKIHENTRSRRFYEMLGESGGTVGQRKYIWI